MPIKIIVADDDAMIRESLKIIIGMDKDFDIKECVENGFEAVNCCKKNHVDVALLDVRMPVMNGVEAVREIVKHTDTRCLILTTFDEEDYIKAALKNGAKGYILKNSTPDKIKEAIRVVYNGNTIMQDVILNKVMNELNSNPRPHIDKSLFSEREFEIMECIAEGLSNREISSKLFISEGTVKNYITSILNKTGLEHRTQIAIYFIKGNVK